VLAATSNAVDRVKVSCRMAGTVACAGGYLMLSFGARKAAVVGGELAVDFVAVGFHVIMQLFWLASNRFDPAVKWITVRGIRRCSG